MKCPIKFQIIQKGWRNKYYSQIVDVTTNEILFTSKGDSNKKRVYDIVKIAQNNSLDANIYFDCDN